MIQSLTPSFFQVPQIRIAYYNKVKAADRIQVTSSQNAYDIFMDSWDMDKIELLEQCKLLMLDRNSACIGVSDIATGCVSGCLVDPKIIFGTALKARTSSIILAHNHPSGNLRSSKPDDKMTEKIARAGRFLDITLFDHLIVTRSNYYSYADNGLIPT